MNDQVRLLYGPLLACVHATRAAYSAMVRQHSPNGTVQVRRAAGCAGGLRLVGEGRLDGSRGLAGGGFYCR